jgi:hypothetical protein
MAVLHKAVSKGTLHKKTAARRISRLAVAVHKGLVNSAASAAETAATQEGGSESSQENS